MVRSVGFDRARDHDALGEDQQRHALPFGVFVVDEALVRIGRNRHIVFHFRRGARISSGGYELADRSQRVHDLGVRGQRHE